MRMRSASATTSIIWLPSDFSALILHALHAKTASSDGTSFNTDATVRTQCDVDHILLPVLLCVGWIVYIRYPHPLAKVPGPWLASLSRLWYAYHMRKGHFDQINRNLHAKYGPVVRIASNEVSINIPEAVPIIYSTRPEKTFTKTDFYSAGRPNIASKHENLFMDRDEAHHAARKRLVANVYNMSSILESEPYIDDCTNLLVDRLTGFAKSGEVVDISRWFQMYAFDVLGELVYGEQFGFLRTSSDVGGWVALIESLSPFRQTVLILPAYLRKWYMMSGLLYPSVKRAIVDGAKRANYARELVHKRLQAMQNGSVDKSRRDVLSKLFELSESKGEKEDFHLPEIEMESWLNIQAGVDTTAIVLQAILYYILKDPRVRDKLLSELEAAYESGNFTIPVKYSDALKLSYLSACIKEAMRLHPSVGLQLPRHPPQEGCFLGGYFFPHSARVGINAAVLHYNPDVFGEDAQKFRPERWFQENAGEMDRYILTFGVGTRTCTGKHISLAKIYKMIPHVLLKFEFKLVDPDRPLTKQDWWFHKIKDFQVTVIERHSMV